MVEVQQHEQSHLIILQPNRSMTWEGNKIVLAAMLFVGLTIGIGFALVGAWMILPFAGLELMCVGLGMYYVCWKQNFTETISLEASSIILQKGVYFPKQQWQWQTNKTWLVKQDSQYRLSAPTLYLQHMHEIEEIGAFLNRKEKLELRRTLNDLGVPTRTLSAG